MGERRWAMTAVLVVVALICAATDIAANRSGIDAEDRRDAAEQQLSETTSDLEDLQAQVDAQVETQADLEARVEALASVFSPDKLNAVVEVQTDALTGACASARSATRDSAALPTGDSVAGFAVVAAPAAHAELEGLPDQWGRMLDPAAIQAEIDRCSADEQATIDAEAAAAAAAAAAERQAAADSPIGYDQCLADFPDIPGLCADTDGNGYAGPFQPGADI